jgi:PEP-CTERM motif
MARVARQLSFVVAVLALAIPVNAAPLLVNGDFEAGGGSFAGWTVLNQADGLGNWFIQSGTVSPDSGSTVPAPPGPTHAAMTDQTGPGSHVLYQDFLVPFGTTSASLSLDLFIQNQSGAFVTPDSLDFNAESNQQARIDIISTSADPFSVAAGDVLLNLFQTQVGDPTVSGYNPLTFDLSALLAASAGQTLRLRFAEADNQFFFQMGVDRVSLEANGEAAIPEPATLTLVGMGVVGLLRRRRKSTL